MFYKAVLSRIGIVVILDEDYQLLVDILHMKMMSVYRTTMVCGEYTVEWSVEYQWSNAVKSLITIQAHRI